MVHMKYFDHLYSCVSDLQSGLWRFKLHWKWPKGCTIPSCRCLRNDTKKWFFTNWGGDNNSQGIHERMKFWKKIHCLLSKMINNNQLVVYGVLDSTNELRSIFVGQYMKLWNFENLLNYFTVAWPGSETRNKVSFDHIYW